MKTAELRTVVRSGASLIAVSAFMVLGVACSQAGETEAVQTAAPQPVETAEVIEIAAPQAEPARVATEMTAVTGEPAAHVQDVAQDITEQATETVVGTATEVAAEQVEPTAEVSAASVSAKAEESVTAVVPASVQAVAAPALQEAERIITTAEGLEAKAQELQEAAPVEASIDDVVADASLGVSGDAEAGKRVFAVCRSCHSTDAGRNGLGPSLAGVVGREAGSVEGFKYSDAIKASGVTWTSENLDTWLVDSAGFIPGNRMSQLFRPGVQDDTKRADLIAYLATL